ncbi:hypothetical protein E2C01_077820 [Portunus trituberculatus]|uniref:Uncharacterized protein n=1 Tax=Portunus trituberculatus TaxID=210409 RepID=A0A5B7IN17_PORTR|nr:hypothetical protein [Portunus trituberculatus]
MLVSWRCELHGKDEGRVGRRAAEAVVREAGEGGWRRARATLPDVVHQRVFLLGPPSHAGPQVTVIAVAGASRYGTCTGSAKIGSPSASLLRRWCRPEQAVKEWVFLVGFCLADGG